MAEAVTLLGPLDLLCGFAHRDLCGYMVIEDRCTRKPCPKCGLPLAHGREGTFRSHECAKWYLREAAK